MKHNWWDTEIARFVFLHISAFIAMFLLVKQNEFWIGVSGLYIILFSLFYLVSQNQKDDDIDGLYYRVNRLEQYNKYLEEELEKARADSQQD